MTPFPAMVKIRQHFKTQKIADIPDEINQQFRRFRPEKIISPGETVAVTAGSRGICNIAKIIGAVVYELKAIQAKPFVVPAMGSHGGATAEGQLDVLKHYGITDLSMGVPIKSSMEAVKVGQTQDGVPVFIDKNASQADHVVVVNRVKPHTDFEDQNESGLLKMMAIGLGKQAAASRYHNEFMRIGHHRMIESAARVILEKAKIAFAVGIVENQKEETGIIQVIHRDDIVETDKKLLTQAKSMLPRIPFDPIDILVVDEMGKTISGTGMDQNVIARTVISYHKAPAHPKINRIIVRDFVEGSDGNATGLGNADFTTRKLIDKIDRTSTYMNAITASCPEIIRIPPYYDSDREVLEAALQTIPDANPDRLRMVQIQNTLRLEEMAVSKSLVPEARQQPTIEIVGRPEGLDFDAFGNMQKVSAFSCGPGA